MGTASICLSVFQSRHNLLLHRGVTACCHRFSGELPQSWAGKGRFPSLQTLNLGGNELEGTLPQWKKSGAWRALQRLDLTGNKFYGKASAACSTIASCHNHPNCRGQPSSPYPKGSAWPCAARAARNNQNRTPSSGARVGPQPLSLLLPCPLHAGGLPASWLSKKLPFRKLERLYLGGNRLGEDEAGNLLPKEQWCQSEADAGLASGSGWCPQGSPLRNAAAKLTVLDLSDNSFTGGAEGILPRTDGSRTHTAVHRACPALPCPVQHCTAQHSTAHKT